MTLPQSPPRVNGEHRVRLTIRVSWGIGTGDTRLAAFDGALQQAGVAAYNLVRISSIVPPGSEVLEVDGANQLPGHFGDLLYCVYADAYAAGPGQSVSAGLAWSQAADGSGRGLFVEHTGRSRKYVDRELRLSLAGLGENRGGGFTERGRRVVTATWTDRPVCALVVAAYRVVDWA